MSTHRIAVVGAGRVGQAFLKIMEAVGITDDADIEVHVLDTWTGALSKAGHNVHLVTLENVQDTLRSIQPTVVVCSTPFTVNVLVAQVAAELKAHYIDFTEDVEVTDAISKLEVDDSTFVPQTGLAPGLVSYFGHELINSLGCSPYSLDLRVGALPQVSFGPAHYAVTWSPAGLINEYLKPASRKEGGFVFTAPSLGRHEEVMVNGVRYEGFSTSGGVGLLSAYDHIPNVEYKTLRHPGHHKFLLEFLDSVEWDLERGKQKALQTFTTTRDDVVVMVAHAVNDCMQSASAGIHFYPQVELGLTALELTTAGTGVAVLELLLREDVLPKGVLHSGQIPFQPLMQTQAMALVLSSGR